MSEQCQIPRTVEKILSASHCSVAFIGGSLTVGVGASNSAETSFRALFIEHLYREYHPRFHCQVSEVMGAVGACESYVAAFTLGRNVMPAKPDLALLEFCVNDLGAPDKALVTKGMEGMVRQLLAARHACDVMILGCGNRDGTADQTLHRQVAEHYGVPFVDIHAYTLHRLKERGQSWDDIEIAFEKNDPHHVNDDGNRLYFEAIRDAFAHQVELFRANRGTDREVPLPPPLAGDELQYAKLIDPAKKSKSVMLQGDWSPKRHGAIPWYFDNLLVGKPSASMTVEFTGTAVAVFGLMYNNGLKLEAELDGEPVPGPYLRHFIEFGKGLVLAHGLVNEEHVLKLTVGQPSKRHNKLANPTARIGYIGVAQPPRGD